MSRRLRVPTFHLSRRNAIAVLGGGIATGISRHAAAQSPASHADDHLTIVCEPCQGSANAGSCCLPGLTGGGVLQLDSRQAQVVVFAMRLDDSSAQQATGFVRWIDERWQDGPLTLESIGPITYKSVADDEQARDIRGVMQANGQGEFAFHLRLTDFGPGRVGEDTATLTVSSLTTNGESDYRAQGLLVGGDFQLLNSVAPIS